VVDNGGRLDESCVGDLVVHEADTAGLAGIVIWGLHRDTTDIQTIGLPVWSNVALHGTFELDLDKRLDYNRGAGDGRPLHTPVAGEDD